jgi:hypothetical protein
MPRRDQLDPCDLRAVLPDLMLVGVEPNATAETHLFTYRLVGTRIDDRLGVSITGKLLEPSLLGTAYDEVHQHYQQAVLERRPHVCRQRILIGDIRRVDYECLVAPLSGPDDRTVVALVAAIDVFASCLISDDLPPFAAPMPAPTGGACLPLSLR